MREKVLLPTLLIIAEDPSIRAFLKKHLDAEFFILYAETKARAFEAVNTSVLDFVIVDAKFEDYDALKLCEQLRPRLVSAATPVLLITGRLNKTYRDQALDSGVTDFLNDHLELEELETRIATGRKAAEVRRKTTRLAPKLPTTKPKSSLKNRVTKRK